MMSIEVHQLDVDAKIFADPGPAVGISPEVCSEVVVSFDTRNKVEAFKMELSSLGGTYGGTAVSYSKVTGAMGSAGGAEMMLFHLTDDSKERRDAPLLKVEMTAKSGMMMATTNTWQMSIMLSVLATRKYARVWCWYCVVLCDVVLGEQGQWSGRLCSS